MKRIKKFIPEIITGIVLIALIVGLIIVTKKLNSNSVYDGNYIGGDSSNAYVEVDVKWIPSLEEIPGVDKIQFSKNGNFTEQDKEIILSRDGWYWLSYNVKANTEKGYFEREFEDIIVADVWTDDLDFVIFFTVEDGKGYITKSEEHPKNENDETSPVACDIYFSNNGACFCLADYDVFLELYLEKNGALTAYTLQIVQSCLIGVMAILGIVYIVYAFIKRNAIYIAVILVVMVITFLLMYNQVRDDSIGEWRGIEDEDKIIMIPKYEDGKYIMFEGIDANTVYRIFGEEYEDVFYLKNEPYSEAFYEDYKRFDLIPGYTYYPFVLCLDIIAGVVLGGIGFILGSKGKTVEDVQAYNGWVYPFGEYSITGIKYLSEAFSGMEEYFMTNASQSKMKFLLTYFAFDDIETDNPKYVHEYKNTCLFEGSPEEKMHVIKIKDSEIETEYDLCVAKKGMYIRKKLENAVIIVYEIQMKEG